MDIKRTIKNLIEGKEGDVGTVLALVSIAVAVLVLAVIFTVGPLVGYNVDSAVSIPANNSWNSVSGMSGMTNGTEIWTQTTPMLAVAALIAIVGVIIFILMSVARPGGGGPQ